VLQAPLFHGPSFDLFPFEQEGLATPGIDVGWSEIVQALVMALLQILNLDRFTPHRRTCLSFNIL